MGSFLQDNEFLDSDALHTSKSALGACSPIAHSVFGSDACCARLKFQLLNALINSTLLTCAHVVSQRFLHSALPKYFTSEYCAACMVNRILNARATLKEKFGNF